MQDKAELVNELRKAVLGNEYDLNDPRNKRVKFKEETNTLVIDKQLEVESVTDSEPEVMSEEELFSKLLQQSRDEKRK